MTISQIYDDTEKNYLYKLSKNIFESVKHAVYFIWFKYIFA